MFELPKKTNLHIINVNCQSINSKKQELAAVLQYVKPDIVCGTESWVCAIQPGKPPINDHIKSLEVFPDSYEVYRSDRTTVGGGVFILVHKSLTSSEQPQLVTDCEMKWVKVNLKNEKDLLVGAFYMAERDQHDLNQLQRSLNLLTEDGSKQREVILAGDFNCPDIDWSTHTAHSSGQDNLIQQTLVDISSSSLLSQVQHTPTRGKSLLDLVFASNPTLVTSSISIPGVSDHDIVCTDYNTKPQVTRQKARKCFKFKQADWEQIKKDMDDAAHTVEEEHRTGKDADTLWTTFKPASLTP